MSDEQTATLKLTDLPPGTVKQVIVGNEEVAVCNVGGELYAIRDQCTHAGIPLSTGPLDGYELICPWHGAGFDVRSGCPTSPPAFEACRRYTVATDGDTVTVTDRIPEPPKP